MPPVEIAIDGSFPPLLSGNTTGEMKLGLPPPPPGLFAPTAGSATSPSVRRASGRQTSKALRSIRTSDLSRRATQENRSISSHFYLLLNLSPKRVPCGRHDDEWRAVTR